jgi:hypothetical protein
MCRYKRLVQVLKREPDDNGGPRQEDQFVGGKEDHQPIQQKRKHNKMKVIETSFTKLIDNHSKRVLTRLAGMFFRRRIVSSLATKGEPLSVSSGISFVFKPYLSCSN